MTTGSNGNGDGPVLASELSETERRTLAIDGASSSARVRSGGRTVKIGPRSGMMVGPTPPGSGTAFPEWTFGAQIAGMFQSYAPLAYMIPWQLLDYIELLATYNPDMSQAVDNVRTLANSGHNLFVQTQTNSTRANQQLHDFLMEKSKNIYSGHGGIHGLIDQLLDQAAVYGAMCGEWYADENLTEVVGFTVVNPKHIRFFWDLDRDDWVPYQVVNAIQQDEAKRRGQQVKLGAVELNPDTFHYYAFDAAPGSPYGTPPFLASLSNIAIQRDMVNNMAQIVKKVGLLGVIDLTIKSLPPKPGETDDQFQSRAGQFLDNYVTIVEDMVRDGGVIHFDDVDAKTYNITGNAAGATNIFKQNEELIFSGLKSMPSVQGRSYSSTETYAGVAYDIIIRNTYKYQRAVRSMIESGYWLMATLAGFSPKVIRLEFLPNKSLHRLQDAQAQRLEIFNALVLWVCGFIDQTGAAQLLGFQAPITEMDEPPASPLLGQFPPVGISAKGADEEGQPQPTGTTTQSIEAMIEDKLDELAERVVSELTSRSG